MRLKKQIKHGDTIVEVMLSIAIFSAVAMLTINLMNRGLNTAQTTLEATMARAAIDSQAETIRFVHNSYTAERNFGDESFQFGKLWEAIAENAIYSGSSSKVNTDIDASYDSCEAAISDQRDKAFVVNPRLVFPRDTEKDLDYKYILQGEEVTYSELAKNYFVIKNTDGTDPEGNVTHTINTTPLYPRIVYHDNSDSSVLRSDITYYPVVESIEGVWTTAYRNANPPKKPDHYDFYINVCWDAPGQSRFSTITTIVRLHNPEK